MGYQAQGPLKYCLPEAVKVAVFVDCDGFFAADEYDSFGFILEVDADSAVFCLDVDECDVMLREHRMKYAADLDPDGHVIDP